MNTEHFYLTVQSKNCHITFAFDNCPLTDTIDYWTIGFLHYRPNPVVWCICLLCNNTLWSQPHNTLCLTEKRKYRKKKREKLQVSFFGYMYWFTGTLNVNVSAFWSTEIFYIFKGWIFRTFYMFLRWRLIIVVVGCKQMNVPSWEVLNWTVSCLLLLNDINVNFNVFFWCSATRWSHHTGHISSQHGCHPSTTGLKCYCTFWQLV